MDNAIAAIKPGVGSDEIASLFPTADSLGFDEELSASGLQLCHELGLGLHERPATDGYSAARIEEKIAITDNGPVIITRYPATDLVVAHPYRFERPDYAPD